MRISSVLAGLCLVLLSVSCSERRDRINLSSIREEVSFVRFDEELFALGVSPQPEDLLRLRVKYPAFTDLYTWQVLRTGSVKDSAGRERLLAFVADTVSRRIKEMTFQEFGELQPLRKEFVHAFKRYRYYFPGKPLPVLYFCISGFNESVFTAENIVGISLDKYLGPGCNYYNLLDLPRYKKRKMIPKMMVPDVVYAWGMTEFEMGADATTLADHIVYQGKLMVLMEKLLPGVNDTLRLGFTEKQLEWCRMNEVGMWNYLVERQLLFSTRQMDIVRYIHDGPTTNGFPPESPARTGIWLGRQIVRAYLKRNPGVTLAELMANRDYRQILNSSAYAPQ